MNRILPFLAGSDGASDGPPVRGPRSEWRPARGVYHQSVTHFGYPGQQWALDLVVCRPSAWDAYRASHRDRFELSADPDWRTFRVGPFVLAFLVRFRLSDWDRQILARAARDAKGGAR